MTSVSQPLNFFSAVDYLVAYLVWGSGQGIINIKSFPPNIEGNVLNIVCQFIANHGK